MSTRKRPAKDTGDRDTASLLEMESRAQQNIKANGRLSSLRQGKLVIPFEPNPDFEYYWASENIDSTGSHQRMLAAGYTFCTHEHGEMKGEVVANRTRSTTMYLMKIPRKDHEELKRLHRDRVNETEVGLRKLEENQYGSANGSNHSVKQELETSSAFNPLLD